jgi:hypothetical protein
MAQNTTYGKVKTPEGEFDIVDYIQLSCVDHRLISIVKLSDESFMFIVENPSTTGREPKQQMRLTKESMIALYTTFSLYIQDRNMWEEIMRFRDMLAESKETRIILPE